MLPSSKIVKRTAFTAMKGRFGGLFFASLTVIFAFLFNEYLFSLLLSTVGAAVAYITFFGVFLFLLCPLSLGLLRFVRRLLFSSDDRPVAVFYYFTNSKVYMSSLTFSLLLFVRGFLAAIIFFIPAFTARLLSDNSFYITFHSTMPSWASHLWIVASVLELLAIVAVFLVLLKYYAAPFIFVANDDVTPEKAIDLSLNVSRDTTTEFFWFSASLIVAILLSVFIVPLVVTLPYILCCYCVFCRFSLARYNKMCDNSGACAPTFSAN